MQSQAEFNEAAIALSREARELEGMHRYFVQHQDRLYRTCRLFGLFERPLGDVLEIGPFFGYTPFFLRNQATSYAVLEGDDPAVYSLKPLYERRGIQAQFTDLFESFGPTHSATHRLPFPDGSFNSVLCWETMEHFNFNPVIFVRELHRVLKPGGRAYIQVPNRASLQNLVSLVLGRGEREHIEAYFTFENYVCNGKKAFYGFHWREYSPQEIEFLFQRAGFNIRQRQSMVTFQSANVSPARRLARLGTQCLGRLLPRYGTDICLTAER